MLRYKDIVKTRSSEESRNGRVSIRDHPDNLTFTVTLEKLTQEDAGTYMCGVDFPFLMTLAPLGSISTSRLSCLSSQVSLLHARAA